MRELPRVPLHRDNSGLEAAGEGDAVSPTTALQEATRELREAGWPEDSIAVYVSAVTALEKMAPSRFQEAYKARLRASMERNRAILQRLGES